MSTHGEIISVGDAIATLDTLMQAKGGGRLSFDVSTSVLTPAADKYFVRIQFGNTELAPINHVTGSTLLAALESMIDEVQR